ncbi:MAG: 23S rRNA (uracil(1939)-C(5))-methyltransferase RlmD [Elusimicrobiaceae bacterium]|jgi:23S rRNA (uracil1939-C5)-methyltransferase|nr:23S rRNA (uracil(1939)-C(5))-methyltransferase RlmD [Elusimicrobiaceae bacterium]
MTDKNNCKHLDICGGCSLTQNYEEQLALKQEKVKTELADFWKKDIPITPSLNTIYHRNKVELSFCNQVLWKDGKPPKKEEPLEFEKTLGFRQKKRWDRCVNMEECFIFSPHLAKIKQAIYNWANKENISFYDSRKRVGTLRQLMLREGKNTDEMMLVIVSTQNIDVPDSLLKELSEIIPNINILCAINDAPSDATPIENVKVLQGKDNILEKLVLSDKEISFRISAKSFFQTNTKTAELLYDKTRKLVKKIKPKIVYDLYGGAGCFSFVVSDLCEKTFCIENVSSSIKDGEHNAKINNITNVKFLEASVEDYLKLNKIPPQDSLVIVDPPRAGIHPKSCKKIANSGVEKIIYVSCNPKTLADNLTDFTKNYKIETIEAFDFFPHTNHVETMVIMNKINNK